MLVLTAFVLLVGMQNSKSSDKLDAFILHPAMTYFDQFISRNQFPVLIYSTYNIISQIRLINKLIN